MWGYPHFGKPPYVFVPQHWRTYLPVAAQRWGTCWNLFAMALAEHGWKNQFFGLGSVFCGHAGRKACSLEETVSFASRVQTNLEQILNRDFLGICHGEKNVRFPAWWVLPNVCIYYSQPLPLIPRHMARCSWTRCLPSPAALCKADFAWSTGPGTMLLVHGVVAKNGPIISTKGFTLQYIFFRGSHRHLKPLNMMVGPLKLRSLPLDDIVFGYWTPQPKMGHHGFQDQLANICWNMLMSVVFLQ